jgi:hypothetical protein
VYSNRYLDREGDKPDIHGGTLSDVRWTHDCTTRAANGHGPLLMLIDVGCS